MWVCECSVKDGAKREKNLRQEFAQVCARWLYVLVYMEQPCIPMYCLKTLVQSSNSLVQCLNLLYRPCTTLVSLVQMSQSGSTLVQPHIHRYLLYILVQHSNTLVQHDNVLYSPYTTLVSPGTKLHFVMPLPKLHQLQSKCKKNWHLLHDCYLSTMQK